MLISRINCRISVGTAGRPRRRLDFQRQNNRKPARCHRTTVSGRTMASAPRAFGNRWQTQPRTTLSTAKNGNRLGLPRRSTMICCRNTRISASNAARGRNRSRTIPKIVLQRSNIPQKIIRFCVSRQLDGIYDRDRGLRCNHAAPRLEIARHVIDAFLAKDYERAAAMNLIGLPVGEPYPPYAPLSRDEIAALAGSEHHRTGRPTASDGGSLNFGKQPRCPVLALSGHQCLCCKPLSEVKQT